MLKIIGYAFLQFVIYRINCCIINVIVDVEKCTGSDLKDIYRETSLGGLAKIYEQHFSKNKRVNKK